MKCTYCEKDGSAKAGRDRKGQQRFRCNCCKKTFLEPHALAGKRTGMEEATKVLAMLLEGMSIRSCARLTGISKRAILAIMVQAGESCRQFTESKIRNVKTSVIECDEQWAFVFCKKRTAERLSKGRDCGDRYVFTALDRDSKLLICWQSGARDAANQGRNQGQSGRRVLQTRL